MIEKDRKIWGWNDNLADCPLPEPFNRITRKNIKKERSGIPVTMTVVRSLTKAVLSYIEKDDGMDTISGGQIALGSRSTEDGEMFFVEYTDEKQSPDEVQVLSYDPKKGVIRGAVYNLATRRCAPLQIEHPKKGLDGTGVWLVLLPTLLENPILNDMYCDYANFHMAYQTGEPTTEAEIVDQYDNGILPICYEVYEACKNNSFNVELAGDLLPQLRKTDIETGALAPSKVIFGSFKVFSKAKEVVTAVHGSLDDFKGVFTFQNEALTEEEILLIPSVPEDNVTPPEALDLLAEMRDTWNNPPATKLTQVLMEGGAGTGKSYLARLLAAVLQRPFVSFTCSPNTDETDIKGALLPVVDAETAEGLSESDATILDAIYKAKEGSLYSEAANAMGLPSMTQCFFDPEGSFEFITGTKKENCDSQTAYTALCDAVMGKIKELMQKVQSPADGVKYKYIPSPIVSAIKNGWVLELQEPSVMIQQGMLSCLFDVLDKDSIGVLNTVTGPVYRHPDFMVIATTNRKYKGTKPLNEAARSRFQYFLKMDTPSDETIIQRVTTKTGLTDLDTLRGLVQIYKCLETQATDMNASGAVTLRGLYACADAINRGKPIRFALNRYLISAISTDEEELSLLWESIEDCELMQE